MRRKIRIKIEAIEVLAELKETKTAEAIWEALPIRGRANTWGEEIYFKIPVKIGIEDGQIVVGVGDLGYWPAGNAFCVFFGPTPVSHGEEIRAAGSVNVFGKVIGDTAVLKKVRQGDEIIIERTE